MKKFEDYNLRIIRLSPRTEEHIASSHPEIKTDQIAAALLDPDEVRRSSRNRSSNLYYRKKTQGRFVCVVVKSCSDGDFVSTAMTATKPKFGEVIYVKKV